MSAAPGRPKHARTEGEAIPVNTRVWSLRSHLSALLVVTMGVTVTVVAIGALLRSLPQVEHDSLVQLRRENEEVSIRLLGLLRVRQARLNMLAEQLRARPPAEWGGLLAPHVGPGQPFLALYLQSPQGQVQVARLAPQLHTRDADLVGDVLGDSTLFQQAQVRDSVVWSGKYLSGVSGTDIVGLARGLPTGQVLVGEMAQGDLLSALQSIAGRHASAIWIVDQAGEVIADTDNGRQVGRTNVYNWPALRAARGFDPAPTEMQWQGHRVHVVVQPVSELGWMLVGHAPTGWNHPQIRDLVAHIAVAFLSCLAVALLFAPFWARRMASDLRDLLTRAALTTAGRAQGRSWPRGDVTEFNALSADLEQVAATLQEREQKFVEIFNATPVPMVVTGSERKGAIFDANEAWCQTFGFTRDQVLGRTGVELGLFQAETAAALLRQMRGGSLSADFVQRDSQGVERQVHVFGRFSRRGADDWMIWAVVDIGPIRALEQALQELNQQLEARVQERTRALAGLNAQLTQTLAQLQLAQEELVRSDKLAALGGLVAGVAHELNTPLGNGVMAISALAEATRRFRAGMDAGLRRTDLRQLLDSAAQGIDIAQRNLRRAHDLLQSFKQVAVDQTSAQRRRFELGEVVHEIVVSLRPSLNRTAYRIEVEVPSSGLRLDSYPGALGQTIANLIQNAVFHGFDGRAHGTVQLVGGRQDDGLIFLRVQDDGNGIAAEHIGRIFEPFMTTKQGRGGSGLGLHISRNAIEGLLGGRMSVHSTPGQGSCFLLLLPEVAPRADADGTPRAALAGGA